MIESRSGLSDRNWPHEAPSRVNRRGTSRAPVFQLLYNGKSQQGRLSRNDGPGYMGDSIAGVRSIASAQPVALRPAAVGGVCLGHPGMFPIRLSLRSVDLSGKFFLVRTTRARRLQSGHKSALQTICSDSSILRQRACTHGAPFR